jgi:O-antigen ligase/tetratricopeptide (TPR) repeat protein
VKLPAASRHPVHLAFAVGVTVLVALAAFFKGGVHPRHFGWVMAGVSALGVGWLWLVPPLPGLEGRRTAARPLLIGALLFLVAGLQLVPVSPELLRSVSPARMAAVDAVAPEATGDEEVFLGALTTLDLEASVGLAGDTLILDGTLGEGGATVARPLHQVPSVGAWQLGRWATAVVVFCLALAIARRRRGATALAVGLTLLGVTEAFWGLANQAGTGASLGLFAKEHYLGSATGTLVNRNHFAALVVVCLGACWGLASTLFPLRPLVVRQHAARGNRSTQPPNLFEAAGDKLPQLALLAFFSAVMSLAVVLSRSRGGLLTLCVAGLCVALIGWRRRQESWHLILGVGLPLVGTTLAVASLGVQGALGRFRALLRGDDSVTGRLGVWADTLQAWADTPFAGVGLGAFDQTYPTLVDGPYLFHFAHAHNDLLQLLYEGGLMLTLPALCLVVLWGLRVSRSLDAEGQGFRADIGLGMLVGVIAMSLHALLDFNFQIPGNTLVFAIALACATAAFYPHLPRGGLNVPVRGLLTAVLLVVGAIGVSGAQRDAAEARAERELALFQQRDPLPQDRARITQVLDGLADHPGEVRARLHMILASLETQEARERPTPEAVDEALSQWSQAADTAHPVVLRDPLDVSAHLVEARAAAWMAGVLRSFPDAPGRWNTAYESQLFRSEQALARALTLQPNNPRLLVEAAGIHLRLGRVAITADASRHRAASLLGQAVAMDPWRAAAAFRMTDDLHDGQLASIGRAEARSLYEEGRAWKRRGDLARAKLAWLEATEVNPDYGPPWFALGQLAHTAGDTDAAEHWLSAYLKAPRRNDVMEGWSHLWLGRPRAAVQRFARVLQHDSENGWARMGLATAQEADHQPAEALKTYREVLQRNPEHGPAQARVAALEGTN